MSIRDVLDRVQAEFGNDPRLTQKSLGEQLGGLPGSFIAGFGDLLGMHRSPEQSLYDRKYPVSSFLGGLAGYAVPYGGAYKAVRAIPQIEKAVKGLELFGSMAKSPIKNRMLQEAARLAVVETGRVGAGMAIPGGDSLEQMLGDSALNISFGTGLSGGIDVLAQAGKRNAPLQEIFKDIDLNAASQVQMRQLSSAIADGKIDPKWSVEARNRLAKLGDQVRTQDPASGIPYVGPTLKSSGKRLNRIFNWQSEKPAGAVRRRFARTSKGGFARDVDWQAAVQRAGLPEDWQQYVQYPRHVSFRTESGAKQIQNTVNQTMTSAGDGWYMTREQNDGLFVLARRLAGKASKPSHTDEWVFFKTDKPGKFRPLHQDWQTAVADHMHFLARDMRPKGPVTDIYDSARKMIDTLPLRKYVDSGAAKGSLADMSGKMAKAFGVDGALENTGEMTKRVKDFLVEHLAPTVQQFGRSPRAGRVFGIAQATYDSAESAMRKLVWGERNLDPKKMPLTHILGKPVDPSGPSIKGVLEPLTDDEIGQLHTIWKQNADLAAVDEMYAKGQVTENVKNAAKALDDIDKELSSQIVKVEEATGGGSFKPKEGHYGLSRSWDGDNRVAIRDVEDKLVAIAAGESRVGAQRQAAALLKQLEDEGMTGLRQAEEFDITNTASLPQDIKFQVRSPAWVLERQNIRGYKFDDKPFTKKELLDAYAASVQRRTRYMASRTVEDLLADDIARTAVEDPTMHRILVGRLNDLAGQRTPLAKVMDQAVDTVLGPVLGKNTASKIVAGTNKAMWHLELGALRLAYPAMNMLTFLQTTMPEVAFVQSADPNILAKYYDVFTTMGAKTARAGGFLSPLKMMKAGLDQIKSREPDFIKAVEKGVNEGVIDPRFIEESTGSVGQRAFGKTGLKGGEGFMDQVQAISEYLPAQSEKLSRLHSFGTGWRVFKDLIAKQHYDALGSQGAKYSASDLDEMAYRFAKQFTDRTQFRYGMDARPRIFTTPAGSLLGLFKNWMMHYVGTMLDYGAEGAMRNNWAPLLWQTAGTAAVGGASALPLWAVANGLSSAFTGKSALVNGYEMMDNVGAPEKLSDAIFYGLPALAGVALTGQAAAPLSNPMRDVTQFFSIAHWDRVQALQRAMGGAMDHYDTTGESPFADPNTRDMIARALAPKTMYRLLQTLGDSGIDSLTTGNPVMQDVGTTDKVLFTLGFNPLQIQKAYAVHEELLADQKAHKAAVQKYGEALANAYTEGDIRQVEEIAKNAILVGLDMSSIERSALSRMSKEDADILTRSFKPEDLEERLVVMGKGYKPPEKKKKGE